MNPSFNVNDFHQYVDVNDMATATTINSLNQRDTA